MNKRSSIDISSKSIKILTVILLIILFTFVAVFLYADIVTDFESWVYSESVEHMSPVITACMKIITHLGDSITVIILCLVLFTIPYLRKNYALPISISVTLATGINALLKHVFIRPRPDILRLVSETGYSFPSGHSMISMALYGAFALLAWKNMSSIKSKIITTMVCLALIAMIGFSRIYLGVHYITDVIGGWCLGLAIALGVVFGYDKITTKNED